MRVCVFVCVRCVDVIKRCTPAIAGLSLNEILDKRVYNGVYKSFVNYLLKIEGTIVQELTRLLEQDSFKGRQDL